MSISKEKAGALGFFILSVVYGWYATEIPIAPGAEEDVLTGRTMPMILAWTGGIASFLLLALPQKGETVEFTSVFKGLNWGTTITLLVIMVLYGLLFTLLGFTVATILFLISSIYVLGERRWKVVLGISIILPIAFWALLTQALGIYLAPAEILYYLGLAN